MKTVYELKNDWQKEVASFGNAGFSLPLSERFDENGKELKLSRGFVIPENDENSDFFLTLEMLSGEYEIFIDGKKVCSHRGIYAPFSADITDHIEKGKKQTLTLSVAPLPSPSGDFVFGGAKLTGVNKSHFDLRAPGASPISVRPVFAGTEVRLNVSAEIVNPNNYDIVIFKLTGPDARTIEERTEKPTSAATVFTLSAPELWEGSHSAYKYTVEATLKRDALILDRVFFSFGIKETALGQEGLFRLNGLKLPLNGAVLRPGTDASVAAQLLGELDANCVKLSSLDPDEKILTACDELGVTVFFEVSPEIAQDEFELSGITALLSAHPSVSFLCCGTRDMSILKDFTAVTRKNPGQMFTAGGCDILNEDSLADAVPDLLLVDISVSGDSQAFLELENRINEIIKEHPDYRFAVTADAPECIFDRHSAHAVRPDCSQEYFSMWHEKIWHIFYNKKGVTAFFAGYLTDLNDKTQRTGLVTADGESKKDAFWFYRAQFSADGFVKLCSSERTSVTKKYIDVKCYTNTPPIKLTVNGKTKKKYRCDAISDSVYVFRNVKLKRRNNTIVISAASGTDSEVIFRSKSKLAKE